MDLATTLRAAGHATASAFAAMAGYITFVEAPARRDVPAEEALRQWRASFRRATPLMASLAALSGMTSVIGYFATAVDKRQPRFLFGGIAIASVIPFTLAFLLPLNRRLMDTGDAAAHSSADIRALLDAWTVRHAVRTALSAAAAIALLPRYPLAALLPRASEGAAPMLPHP